MNIYKAKIRIIGIITLLAFVLTQCVPAYALRQPVSEGRALGEVKEAMKGDARANAIAEDDAEHRHVLKLAEALSFRIKAQNLIYNQEHPAVQLLNDMLQRVSGNPEIKVYILANTEKNAFALPNKEIYITASLLDFVETEEEIAALLMHEYTHIADEHSLVILRASLTRDISEALGMVPLKELEADVAMMIALDKRGLNPYGALLLTRRFRQDVESRRPSSLYHTRLEVETHDIDWQHGTPMQRDMNLRALLQLWDFRHLSIQTHLIDRKKIFLKSRGPAVPGNIDWPGLSGEEFCIALGKMSHIKSMRIMAHVVRKYLAGKHLDLTERETACFTAALFRFILKKDRQVHVFIEGKPRIIEKNDNSIFDADTVAALLEKDAFNRAGIQISPGDIFALSTASIQQELSDADEDNFVLRCSRLKNLRQSVHNTLERYFGKEQGFVRRWDTYCLSAYIQKTGVIGKADFFITPKETTGGTLTLRQSVPFRALSEDTVNSFFEAAGLEFVDMSELFLDVVQSVGLGELLFSSTDIENGESPGMVCRFFDDIAKTIQPAFEQMMSPMETKNICRLERLYLTLQAVGRYLNEEVHSLAERTQVRKECRAYARDGESVRVPLDAVELLSDRSNLNKFAEKTVLVMKEMYSIPAGQLQSEVEKWWEGGSEDVGRRHKLHSLFSVVDKYFSLEEYEPSIILPQNFHPELDYIRWRSLVHLYRGVGKKVFLRDLNQLFSYMDSEPKLNEAKQFLLWLKGAVSKKNGLGIATAWTFSRQEGARLDNLLMYVKNQFLMALALKGTKDALSRASLFIEEWPIAWLAPQKSSRPIDMMDRTEAEKTVAAEQYEYEKLWHQISRQAIGQLEKTQRFPSSAEDFEKLLSLSCLSRGNWSAMSVAAVSFREAILRSESFEQAFRYLNKYSFLPSAVIQEGLDALVERKATLPQEIASLTKWVEENIERLLESREDILLAELSQSAARVIPQGERLQFLTHLISTNETDRGLKEFLAQRWFRILGSFAFSVRILGLIIHNAGEFSTKSIQHPYSHKPFV